MHRVGLANSETVANGRSPVNNEGGPNHEPPATDSVARLSPLCPCRQDADPHRPPRRRVRDRGGPRARSVDDGALAARNIRARRTRFRPLRCHQCRLRGARRDRPRPAGAVHDHYRRRRLISTAATRSRRPRTRRRANSRVPLRAGVHAQLLLPCRLNRRRAAHLRRRAGRGRAAVAARHDRRARSRAASR